MKQRRTDLSKLKSFKYLLLLTIPIFLELLLGVFVGYVDQIMISKDADAVTAITNTNTILSVFIIAFQVFSMGSVILISNFKNSVDSMNINLDPTGSTSHLYKSLNNLSKNNSPV